MLKKLILENWKSFRYAELPLDTLTVLIGTNASGKSNVVEALEFLQRIANGENIETALVGDKTLPSLRGGVELAAKKGENEFSLKLLVGDEEEETDYLYVIKIQTLPSFNLCEEYLEIIDMKSNDILKIKLMDFYHQAKSGLHFKVRKKGRKVSRLSKTRRNDEKILEQPTDVEEDIQKYLKLPKIATDFTIDNLSNLLVLNPIPSTMRDYSRLSENLESDGSNIAGVLAALTNEKKAEVENTLCEYLKDLPEGEIKKVWAEKVGRLGTDAMLYCQEEWKPGEIIEIDARSISDGTLRFLAILTALLTRPEGSQIVIEEIDNGLHPSRAALLVKILKEIGSKRNIDILLTTHNPALLDAFGPEIVPFVVVAHRDSETGESKLTLLEDIDNFPKLFASYSLGQMTTKGAIERSLSHGE